MYRLLFAFFVFTYLVGNMAYVVRAEDADDLRQKIAEHNTKIEALEKEIVGYQKELEVVGAEKQTLQSAVKTLDISRQKLGTDIKVTENRIYSTDLQIDELSFKIDDQESRIEETTGAVAKALRSIHEAESESLVEVILAYDRLSDFWDTVEALERVERVLREETKELLALKTSYENSKKQSEGKRRELVVYKAQLADQKYVLDATRQEQNTLLTRTKNKESEYQKLLAEKVALREQFERELFNFESALKLTVDPSRIPPAGAGILAWPLDAITVTQYFGNTQFATENPQVYGGKGHNGVDFRASIGTPVKASLAGTVAGTGDTDTERGCYSYGKWVLITHANGLSTLYAHLSRISVTVGQSVGTGDTIGYSGNTGYSTGPHLHFGVYATEGVRIIKLGEVKATTNCKNVAIPVADLKAYLNPLSYL